MQIEDEAMKVEAYICDYKNHLVLAKDIVGIVPSEDLFDRQRSFPTIYQPERAEIHYCVECYKDAVILVAGQLIDRKIYEHEYTLKINELSYGFRCATVHHYMDRKKNREKKSKSK